MLQNAMVIAFTVSELLRENQQAGRLGGWGDGGRVQSLEPSRIRKEAVDINILIKFSNGDRKIMQSIRITSRPPWRIRKWNQLSQFR